MAGGDGKDSKAEPVTEFKFNQKPDTKTGWAGFRQFIWNSDTSEFLGRTGMSWLKIGLFYLVYYTFLAGFFMGMLLIFYQTLDDKIPRWLNTNGIIGGNPGVGFRPMPDDRDIESTLIWFRHGDYNGNWNNWVSRLDTFLEPYKNETAQSNSDAIYCGELAQNKPGESQFCKINKAELMQDGCTKDNNYGYRDGKPCILLKLNRIYGWTPEPIDSNKAPTDKNLPDNIKAIIQKNVDDNKPELNNRVWIECTGENPADVENMGPLKYYPDQGISANYFPYLNQDDYLSPAVFVQFTNPKKGVMMAIECKAYARNIEHDSMERRGLAHFELMID